MAKVISIEVGRSTVKAVEMDFKSRKPKVYKCVETRTPAGAVSDGYLNPAKTDELRDAVRKMLKENKIRTKRVLFTVFSSKIISREVTLPAVREHQISAMVEANAGEYFPIELENYKLAHVKLETYRDGERLGQHKVLVMAAERRMLEGYERLAEALGMYIVDIDYAGNSVVNAAKLNAGADPIMIVKAEEEHALVTILQQGRMMLQRFVNYGASDSEVYDSDRAAAEAMTEALTGSITRVIDFYASNNSGGGSAEGNRRVSKVYIVGEGVRTDALVRTVSEQTGVNCRRLEQVRGVLYSRHADNAKLYLYAAAIGAGISSVGFDVEKEKARHETNYVSACFLTIVLVIVVAAALVVLSVLPYVSAQEENQALTRRKEQLEPARAVHDQYLGIKDFYLKVEYGSRLTEHSNDGILNFLSELEEKLPADASLSDFSSDDEKCVMTMTVADKEAAAGVIKTLREFESLESVGVSSIVESQTEDTTDVLDDRVTVVNFTVTCTYYVEELVEP